MRSDNIQCGGCGCQLDEMLSEPNRPACPACGSPSRVIDASAADFISFREQVGVKLKDPRLTGKYKIKIELISGDDLHRKSGEWYKKVRVIDRENNRYLETITHPDTGDVIHHCEEPLSDHWGHGSDKPQPNNDPAEERE
jgi:hypothetical protein